MYKMLRFELKRGRRFFLLYLCGLTMGYILLNLVDQDHEKIIVTMSVFLMFLPVIGTIAVSIYHLHLDTRTSTKFFYLALPYSPRELINSKLIYTILQYVLYILLLFVYKDAHVISQYIVFVGLAIVLVSLVIQWLFTKAMIHQGFKQ